MILWAKKLDCVDAWPYFSPANYLAPDIKVDEETIAALRQHLKRVGIDSVLMRGKLDHTLRWAAVIDGLPESVDASLPHPYDPILIMYERGGTFSKSDGNLIMVSDRVGFSKGRWTDFDKLTPYVALDKATLDAIDRKAQKKQQV